MVCQEDDAGLRRAARTIVGAQDPSLHGEDGVDDLLLLRAGHGDSGCDSDSDCASGCNGGSGFFWWCSSCGSRTGEKRALEAGLRVEMGGGTGGGGESSWNSGGEGCSREKGAGGEECVRGKEAYHGRVAK